MPVPAGLIVGYEGTVASLAAYSAWDLCDGTDGTPDLSDKFIIGSGGGYSLNDTGGAMTGQVTGSTSTEGAHGPIGGLGGDGAGSGSLYKRGTDGAHSHPVVADLEMPPHRELLYIRANTQTMLPPESVAWFFDPTAPADFTAFADAAGRFLFGRNDDSRLQGGADTRDVTNVNILSDGAHLHTSSITSGNGGSGPHPNASGGAHIHSAPGDETLAVPKPPYLVLLCIKADAEAEAQANFIAAYDGVIGDLGPGWYLCDGNNGTPDMGGRFPLGKDGGTSVGDTGGDLAAVPITGGAVPSASPVHNHDAGSAVLLGSLSDHSNYTWTHDHASWSGDADPTPPYHCLHFIMYTGA